MEDNTKKKLSKKTISLIIVGIVFVLLFSQIGVTDTVEIIAFLWIFPAVYYIVRAKQSVFRKFLKVIGVLFLWITIFPFVISSNPSSSSPSIETKQETALPLSDNTVQKTTEEHDVILDKATEIEDLVSRELGDKNNMGWPYKESIKVTKITDTVYDVNVIFNADDNLSKGLIKIGIQTKISNIMKILYTQRSDIGTVTITALFPLQDKYGNSYRGEVYIAEMAVVEANKINWYLEDSTLALDILPKVYSVSIPHRIF